MSMKPNGRFIDITGQKFGRLCVLGLAGRSERGQIVWNCACDCGNRKTTEGVNLRSGSTKSCGCLKRELARKAGDRTRTHGLTNTSAFKLWSSMIMRCTNPNDKSFPRYGGRGIKVCERWMKFENFLADMGDRPNGLTLDRIDNSGIYEPSNCRWATATEQSRNKRNNRVIAISGRSQCLTDWAKEVGVNEVTVQSRLARGWTDFDAIFKPVQSIYAHQKNLGSRRATK